MRNAWSKLQDLEIYYWGLQDKKEGVVSVFPNKSTLKATP